MFTGIIEDRGKVTAIERRAEFIRIGISTDLDLSDVREGDSIAVDGSCLTATEVHAGTGEFAADVSPETMRVTTLGYLKIGAMVNLEKAMRLGERLGGHLVSGHVDCVGRVLEKRPTGPGYLLGFAVDSRKYLVEKGSVTVDGVSLTVNKVTKGRFWVMIIPHTSSETGLTTKLVNDRVNIEYDIIGKYVENFVRLRNHGSELDEEKLRRHGFV